MGYRNYIGSLSLVEYNKIKDMTKEEIFEYKGEDLEDGCVGVYELVDGVYELGKYVDEFPNKLFLPVFTNKETKKYFTEENDFFIVGKEFLPYLIEHYAEKVRSYYRDMLDPFFKPEGKYRRNPSEFLNSIKTEYGEDLKNHHTFDYNKITSEEETALFNMIEHIRSMGAEWGISFMDDIRPYRLEKGDEVTTSWKYEYVQFELVRIYKTFDWKHNLMIYYGY